MPQQRLIKISICLLKEKALTSVGPSIIGGPQSPAPGPSPLPWDSKFLTTWPKGLHGFLGGRGAARFQAEIPQLFICFVQERASQFILLRTISPLFNGIKFNKRSSSGNSGG